MQQQKPPRPLILSEGIFTNALSTKTSCKMGNVWSNSVTFMLELLQWPTLSNCRYKSRLHMFYKSVYHLTAVQLPPYFLRTQQSTRQYHPLNFTVPSTNCDHYTNTAFFSMNNSRLEQFTT